jgi:4-amino-4-deoxy-L-arabinose transferase-like glycosyltransferase
MMLSNFTRRGRQCFEDLFDALTGPQSSNRVMVLTLGGYVAVWALYATIAKSSQDIHPDMAEMAVWSRQLSLGTPKHPPLGAWLLHIWFGVFPRSDWSYYLFAMTLSGVSLWIAWRIARRYLPPNKSVTSIALLTLVPFYNFFALKYNANAVLTPLWAAATWWFLLSFQTRRLEWAVLAGIGAAAAMLGKYWSILLLAAFGLAALIDQGRARYFRSWAPYISIAVGIVFLMPHVDWLIVNHFRSLDYAFETHPASYLTAIESAFGFIGGSIAYIAIPIIFTLIVGPASLAAVSDVFWPSEPERRFVAVIFWAPFLLAVLIAVLLEVHIEKMWGISMMTLLPIVLFSSPLIHISRQAGVVAVGAAVVFPIGMLAISPIVAVVVHRIGVDNYQDQYALMARALESAWQKQTDKPLRIVGSYSSLVNGSAFYINSQPAAFDLYSPAASPSLVDDESIRRDGVAMICPEAMYACMQMLNGYGEHYHAVAVDHVSLERSYLGDQGVPVAYEIMIIPPNGQ